MRTLAKFATTDIGDTEVAAFDRDTRDAQHERDDQRGRDRVDKQRQRLARVTWARREMN